MSDCKSFSTQDILNFVYDEVNGLLKTTSGGGGGGVGITQAELEAGLANYMAATSTKQDDIITELQSSNTADTSRNTILSNILTKNTALETELIAIKGFVDELETKLDTIIDCVASGSILAGIKWDAYTVDRTGSTTDVYSYTLGGTSVATVTQNFTDATKSEDAGASLV